MGPPVRVSRDGRHFTDHDGRPSFWLGDTQWELFRAFQPDEARRLLERRAAQGFSAVMVMLLGVGASGNADGPADGTCPNVNGEKPWKDGNPARAQSRRTSAPWMPSCATRRRPG